MKRFKPPFALYYLLRDRKKIKSVSPKNIYITPGEECPLGAKEDADERKKKREEERARR